MKEQKEEVQRIEVAYIDKWGDKHLYDGTDIERIRLSIWITSEDSHHIEIPVRESRYRLSGLLQQLSRRLAEGV